MFSSAAHSSAPIEEARHVSLGWKEDKRFLWKVKTLPYVVLTGNTRGLYGLQLSTRIPVFDALMRRARAVLDLFISEQELLSEAVRYQVS